MPIGGQTPYGGGVLNRGVKGGGAPYEPYVGAPYEYPYGYRGGYG